MTGAEVLVGLSEIQVGNANKFSLLGLGSCIAVAMRDPMTGVGGVAHIMLPTAFVGKTVENPAKFADTAIPALIDLLVAEGAKKENLVVAVVGGAQLFRAGNEDSSKLDIGGQNNLAVKTAIRNAGVKLALEDTGGTAGRSMSFSARSGEVRVRTATSDDKVLGVLA